jgi:phospholipid-binding lipoprotein MlaA
MFKRLFILFIFITSPLFAMEGDSDPQYQMSDPFEPINRVLWDFNYQGLDTYIYRPVTETYVDWVPMGGRDAINNFVLNLDEPSTMVNNLIQLEFKHAGSAFYRFAVNSTFGLLGFFDLAGYQGMKRRRESFSNVLGRWSVPNGPYLMVPVIGPRSTRKLVGNIVDSLYFPSSYLTFWQSAAVWGLDGIEVRAGLLGQEPLLEQSLDPYEFAKEAYIQYEAFKFHSNNEDMNLFIQQNAERDQQDLEEFMDEID